MRGLYAIVDPEHCRGREPREICEAILAGGCAALQLRSKRMGDAELLRLAGDLAALCRRASVPFWLNDRLDLALLVQADGLHLGQDDLPVASARRLWQGRPLGRSTHSLAQAWQASREGHEVIGIGPVFPTGTKIDPDPVIHAQELAKICEEIPTAHVAIGGITLQRVPELQALGVGAAAAIGSLCGAHDPESAARALHVALSAPPKTAP